MGRKWPGADVPTGGSRLPSGIYEVAIQAIEETKTNAGHLMYKGTFSVTDPAEWAGSPHWENFAVGNDNDSNADDPETWKKAFGAQRLGNMIDAALVPRTDDVDADLAAAVGQRIVVSIVQTVDDGKRDAKYKGTVRSEVQRFYKRGEAQVGVAGGPTSTGVTPKPAVAAAKPAPAAKPAAAPAAPKAPPQPKAPAAVSCSIEGCAWTGERRDFPAHVQAAHAEDEE